MSGRGAAGAVIIAVLAGCVAAPPGFEAPPENVASDGHWFELWMTDAPAEVTKLDVGFADILVNTKRLQVDEVRMDLLAHQGPQQGLKIASGWVPEDTVATIHILFSEPSAELNGTPADTSMPDPVFELRPSLGFQPGLGHAMLIDMNVSKSLRVENGSAVFAPTAEAVYVEPITDPTSSLLRDVPVFERAQPVVQRLLPALPTQAADEAVSDSAPSIPDPWTSAVPEQTLATGAPVAIDGVAPPTGVQGWFVQFVDGLNMEEQARAIEDQGASPVAFFGAFPSAYVWADQTQADRLAESPFVLHVEPDLPVEWLLSSSRTAIRLPDVSAPVMGLKDPDGQPIDGRGVGVAIIDVGIDGTHPDLPHHMTLASDPLLVVNYKVESLFKIDVPNTDTTSGHGTHVAGILAGRGVLDPTMKGVAPGVKVYGFGVGEASTTLWTTQALDWVTQNHGKVDPPIRLVSNSWQTSGSYNPDSLTSRLVKRLVDEGVVVVFAAGNSGSVDASGQAKTSGECQHPSEGVVCIAAYDDLNIGSRAGKVAAYSSRGATTKPATWPDLSAPGSSIRSASPVLGDVTGTSLTRYAVLDGTSMAAPHVSGVIALMLQADPGLTPAQVEAIVESTAYEFADGGSFVPSADARYNGSHPAKGHGLVDAYAAVQRAIQ